MTPQEINERLCKLMFSVWQRIDPNATTPNDCHCGHGGFWKSPHYGPDEFRNGGKALEFIEMAVADKLARMETSDKSKRPWAGDGDDYDNWFRWLATQDRELKSSIVGSLWDPNDTLALYWIMCRVADGLEPVDIDDANVRDMGREVDGEASGQ